MSLWAEMAKKARFYYVSSVVGGDYFERKFERVRRAREARIACG